VCRGVALAFTSAALAVTAHVVAGGMAPDTGLTALLTAGVAAAGIAMADRRRGTGALLLALGVAQVGMHLILSMAGRTPMASPEHVNGWLMTAAHAVAVLVSAALLAKADAAVFLLAAVLAMLLPRWLSAPPVPAATAVAPARTATVDTALLVLLRRRHARRGPPATC
jgi:hypothetical protein